MFFSFLNFNQTCNAVEALGEMVTKEVTPLILMTYILGELGAVELRLRDSGGVSVRSFIILIAPAIAGMGNGGVAKMPSLLVGGCTARWRSESGDVGETDGGDKGDELT